MSDKLTIDDWIQKGINESDFKKSIDFFEEALFLNPENQDALYHKGITFLQRKQYQDAYRTLKTLTKLNNKHSEAWYSMGLACEMCTDNIPANKFYGKAVTLDPHHIDALNGLLRLSNKNSRKIYCFKRLAETIPYDTKYWIELVELNLIEDEINSASKNLSQALSHHPNNKKLTEL
ncbi:tetratricopeptide repeat protein [Methanolobus sp. ZRKC5]|uniref:tetratricopeptide repeat protein n=1 Tax=unclassified Methanolobus TaxID=2629569 RepID=UPI00313D5E2F